MGKINGARVVLGGALAGVVMFCLDFVINGLLLGRWWEGAMKALGRTMAPSAAIGWILWALLAGISLVWLYAAIRPRFGPGVKTAALAGFAFWIFDGALPTVGMWSFGLFPLHLLIVSTLAGLVEMILAAIAGAWVYKEQISAL